MIEAINASISTAPSVRAIAEEATSSQSFAANPARLQKAGVTAPYLSPHVKLSPGSKPIFVVRDSDTGSQIRQFPTEAQIRAYKRAIEVRAQAQPSVTSQEKTVSPEQVKQIIETSVQFKEERAAAEPAEQQTLPGQSTGEYEAPAPLPASYDEQA